MTEVGGLKLNDLIAVLATGAGAWSIFPKAPSAVTDLFDSEQNSFAELFKWLMVYILIWQGQGRLDMGKSLMGTLVMFLIAQVAERFSKKKANDEFDAVAEALRGPRYKRERRS